MFGRRELLEFTNCSYAPGMRRVGRNPEQLTRRWGIPTNVDSAFVSFFLFGCAESSPIAAHRVSLVVVSGGCSLWWCMVFALWWLPLWWNTGALALGTWALVVAALGLSSCGSRALEHELSMWCTALVASWHVQSSRTRDQTCVPCIGRWIPIYSNLS